MTIALKRIYEPPSDADGYRVLVERLWPRGVSKEKARLDDWAKELAPSHELRRWFDHDPARWPAFRERYAAELAERADAVARLAERARRGAVTFVYASREERYNAAVALRDYLQSMSRAKPK